MKPRIIVSLAVMALAATAAIGGTVAFFSDSEISKNNSFTAGALDLKIDSTCHYDGMICAKNNAGAYVWQNETTNPDSTTDPGLINTPCSCSWLSKDLTANDIFFNFGDVKPGDQGEDTISLTTNNNDSWLCAYVQNLANDDNTCNGPETQVGDVTCGAGGGELQDNLYLTVWRDTDCDNKLDEGGACVANADPGDDNDAQECAVQTNKGEAACNAWIDTPEETVPECHWVAGTSETILVPSAPIDTNNAVWPLYTPATNNGTLPGGSTSCLGMAWSIPTTVGNIIQTDKVTGDISFYIEQSRNNAGFTCPAAPTGPAPKIGSLLSTYVEPSGTSCNVTVDPAVTEDVTHSHTINGGIGLATANQTVCVAAGTYPEDVVVNKSITLAGAGVTSIINGQATGQGTAVSIAANNVTVEGFAINGAGIAALWLNTGVTGANVHDNHITSASGGVTALTTQGQQSNITFTNNEFTGNGVGQIAYVNGEASLGAAEASNNVDFVHNTFDGTIVAGGEALGNESANSNTTQNVFKGTITSTYAIAEAFKADAIFSQNNFDGVGGIKVRNSAGSGTVNAQNNWWGAAVPVGNIAGSVDDSLKAAVAFPEN